MKRFFVCGYDSEPIFLCQRPFDTKELAQAYAATCAKAWKAFVVEVVS